MNNPKKYIDCKTTNTLRAAIENEGKWIYYLTSEGLNNNLSSDFAKDAMRELGEYYAKTVFSECVSTEQFIKVLMNRARELGYEAVVENVDDNGFDLIINYCPMLNMWGKLSDDDNKKNLLCDVACSMYSGLGESKGYIVEKKCSIAHGACNCKIVFKRI